MKDDKAFIKHILDEIDFIIKETKDITYENLIKDEVLKRALLRSLEVIGEATKNLSEGFRNKYSNIKWKELAGLRDKLIHQYFGVNWNRVWDVIKNLIPPLKDELKKVLEDNKT